MEDLGVTQPSSPATGAVHSELVPLAEIMVGQFPDWFPDPSSQTSERFWDGSRWTEFSRIAVPSAEADGGNNFEQPLRLEDFLQPVEPLILAILGEPDLREPDPVKVERQDSGDRVQA